MEHAATEPSTPMSSHSTRTRVRGDALLCAALCVPYLLLVWRFWFVAEDAYISFRYARNLALGNGLRFNLGEHTPVEGYSNFLWVLLCAVFERLGLSVEIWPLLVSVACGLVLMWLVFATLRHRLGLSRPIAAAGVLMLGLYPPMAHWSTSGLATMPFALLLFVCFERLILRRDGIEPISAGVSALALSLIRVEGIFWVVVLLVLAAVSRKIARQRFLKPLLVVSAIVTVGYGAYFAWRYSYYGLAFANTAYAKTAWDVDWWRRGMNYVVAQVLTFVTPILILPASLVALRRGRVAIGLPTATMAIAVFVYAIAVGGDYMAMARFLVPGWPFAVVLMAWLLSDITGSGKIRRLTAFAMATIAVVVPLLPAWNRHIIPHDVRARFHFRLNSPIYRSEYDQWEFERDHARAWADLGRALKRWVRPGSSVVTGAIGARSYYSELFIYDTGGLVSRLRDGAAVPEDNRLRSPGHDNNIPRAYFLDLQPDILHPRLVEGDLRYLQNYLGAFLRRDVSMAPAIRERYVLDIRPVGEDMDNVTQHLALWRRVPDDVSIEAAWEAYRRLQQLIRRGDNPYRAMAGEHGAGDLPLLP